MNPKLNYYKEKGTNREYVAIITSPEFERQAIDEYEMVLVASIELPMVGTDWTDWPADRFLAEE